MSRLLVFTILFGTAYTTFHIPYFALGGFLTTNTAERTKIRSIAQVFNIIGTIAAIAILISWNVTRGYELSIEEEPDRSHNTIFKEIKEIMHLRPFLFLHHFVFIVFDKFIHSKRHCFYKRCKKFRYPADIRDSYQY